MAIFGFNLNKILIEKEEGKKLEKVEVSTRIKVTSIKKEDVEIAKGKDVLKLSFDFGLDYKPDLAVIEFKGHVLILEEPAEAKKILEEWKKEKMNDNLKIAVYNIIWEKCNVKALELEEDFNLPHHIPLGRVSLDKKESK